MSTSPTVYFIDDSATMREVIKIAFRRENIDVVTCHDASSAIDLMEENPPDVVISDVIMPDRDGYDVCNYIKQHKQFAKTPVVLMSGVVNRAVAEKAFAVKADELIRKPFQPHDLITRVRHLLNPKAVASPAAVAAQANASAAALTSIFSNPGPGARAIPAKSPAPLTVVPPRTALPSIAQSPAPLLSATPAGMANRVPPPPSSAASAGDAAKLRVEVLRLQSQIKKLESELNAEREYCRALEEHIKTLQESE